MAGLEGYRNQRFRENYQRFIRRTISSQTDWINPLCMLMLGILGVFFIYSAQKFVGSNFWIKQIVWIFLGAGLYVITSRINYHFLLQNAHWIYLFSIFLLLALWATPFGVERYDSRRWLDFKVFAFQPSETAKIGVLIMVSSVLARSEIGSLGESLVVLGKVFLIVLFPIFLIFLQPDLGSALIFPPMVFTLLYVSRLSKRFFMVVFGLFLIGFSVIVMDIVGYQRFLEKHNLSAYENRGEYQKHSLVPLKDYQRNRIIAFVAPDFVDPQGIGVSWNQRQALQAVGTGGIFGKGYTKGDQAQLGYLPRSVAHNDFIFAVIAEEKGFIGGISVLGIYAILIGNSLKLAGESNDRFGMLLIVGITVIFMIHIFINIGMNIGMMPITGLPLPFVSYGGSFILSACFMQGLVQSVYRHRREFA